MDSEKFRRRVSPSIESISKDIAVSGILVVGLSWLMYFPMVILTVTSTLSIFFL